MSDHRLSAVDKVEFWLGQVQKASEELNDLIVRLKGKADKISSLVEESRSVGEDAATPELKRLWSGANDYKELLKNVGTVVASEVEKLAAAMSKAKDESDQSNLASELEYKVVMAKRMIKTIERDVKISFSRYEHCFRVSQRNF